MNALSSESLDKTSVQDPTQLPMAIWPSQIYPCEPIYGWIQRAAASNYAYSCESFVESLGLNSRDWDYDAMLEVADLLPLQEFDKLAWNTPKRVKGGFELCGHEVSGRLIAKKQRRVCPVCLSEDRYIRVWFDLVPIAACPIHDVRLIEGLPGDPIDWRNPEIGWTRNGIKISREHATPTKASGLDRYAVSAIGGVEFDCPRHLERERLNAVIHAARCVGKLFEAEKKNWSGKADFQLLPQLGFPSLLRGREAVADFLCEAPWLQKKLEQRRYEALCKRARVVLKTIGSEYLRGMVTEGFDLARVRNGTSTPSGRLGKYDGEDGAWALKAAANALKLHPKHLRKILSRLSLKLEQCPRRRTFRVTASQVTAANDYIRSSLSDCTVSQIVGCDVSEVDQLVRRKLLEVDFRCGGQRYFRKIAVDAFMKRILDLRRCECDAGSRSLHSYAASVGISLAEAFSVLARGNRIRISRYDANLPFSQGIFVNPVAASQLQDGSAVFRKATVRPKAQIRNAITFAAAGARIGTGSTGLKELIEGSFLRTIKDKHRKTRICEKSLAAFERDYVRAATFASLLGCHPTSALKILRKAGVQPINDIGTETVKFVSRLDVVKKTEITLDPMAGAGSLEPLRKLLSKSLADQSLPATASIAVEPALTIRATSGRWSFHVNSNDDHYELVSKFRAGRESNRLKKIRQQNIRPKSIWTGAEVHREKGGGFTLIDRVGLMRSDTLNHSHLVERCIMRAHELHRLF